MNFKNVKVKILDESKDNFEICYFFDLNDMKKYTLLIEAFFKKTKKMMRK